MENEAGDRPPERLARVERTLARAAAHDVEELPAWLRRTKGEQRWPCALAVVVMIVLQFALPTRLTFSSRWILPAMEVAIIAVLVAASPGRITRRSRWLRMLGLILIATASLGTAWSVGQLTHDITTGADVGNAAQLLACGGAIWLINVLTFAVWYWELDRGGAAARAIGGNPYPDFMFPQMASPELTPKDWEPEFLDYLYLAFTNATAFSPTDTMPMSRWAKFAMLLESLISLVIAVLVVARAVNSLQ